MCAGGRTKVKSHGVEKVSTFSGITVRKHNRSRAPVTGSSKISSLTATRNTVAAPSNKFMHQTPPKPAATTITTTTSASTTATSLGSSSPAPPPAPPTELKVSHKSGGRNTYSLKHRIIYMLAAKPQNRETIVSKLKKGECLLLVACCGVESSRLCSWVSTSSLCVFMGVDIILSVFVGVIILSVFVGVDIILSVFVGVDIISVCVRG